MFIDMPENVQSLTCGVDLFNEIWDLVIGYSFSFSGFASFVVCMSS